MPVFLYGKFSLKCFQLSCTLCEKVFPLSFRFTLWSSTKTMSDRSTSSFANIRHFQKVLSTRAAVPSSRINLWSTGQSSTMVNWLALKAKKGEVSKEKFMLKAPKNAFWQSSLSFFARHCRLLKPKKRTSKRFPTHPWISILPFRLHIGFQQ